MEATAPPEPEHTCEVVQLRRVPGRPRRPDGPLIPYEELDRLLVFGEVRVLEDGTHTTVYPTYRALAERFGVAVSFIGNYASSRNCMKRRAQTASRVAVRTEEKLINLRADALAVGEDRLVQMIDEFLLKFEQALKEGRVRSDSPADVNTLARLKAFIMGGADSRHEIRAVLSLEALQERHTRMMRQSQEATPAMAGVVGACSEVGVASVDGQLANSGSFPPSSTIEFSTGELNVSPEFEDEVRGLVELARELSCVMGADGSDDELVENRVLRAVQRVEAQLSARLCAHVGPCDASEPKDEQ